MAIQKWKQLNPDCNLSNDFVEKHKDKFTSLAATEGISGKLQVKIDSDSVSLIGDNICLTTSYEELMSENPHWLKVQTLIPIES